VKVPVEGSKISALARAELPLAPVGKPLVIKTRPSLSRVAVWLTRGVVISPVALKVPEEGSKISALARAEFSSAPAGKPPVIRTRPSASKVGV
jgi:hypothetical protein